MRDGEGASGQRVTVDSAAEDAEDAHDADDVGVRPHPQRLLFAKVILPPLAPFLFLDLGATVVNAVCFAAVWVVLWRRGWLRVSGVAVPGPLRRWWLTLPTLAVACSYAVAGLEGRTTVLVSSLVSRCG
jgi:hypothetical protein